MNLDQRTYVIFKSSDTSLVDFADLLDDESTVRISRSGEYALVKYIGTEPASITALTSITGRYTHQEMRTVILDSEWTPPGEVA